LFNGLGLGLLGYTLFIKRRSIYDFAAKRLKK